MNKIKWENDIGYEQKSKKNQYSYRVYWIRNIDNELVKVVDLGLTLTLLHGINRDFLEYEKIETIFTPVFSSENEVGLYGKALLEAGRWIEGLTKVFNDRKGLIEDE